MRLALGGFFFVAFVACAAAQDDAGKKLAKELEGKYDLVGLEADGKKQDPKQFGDKFEVKDSKLIAVRDKKADPIGFTLDPSKKPGWIDFSEEKPNGKTRKSFGIYKVDNGVLTVCISDEEDPAKRPKEFKTDGGMLVLMVLKKTDK